MTIAVPARVLRLAAEVMTNQALVERDADLAQESLDILDKLKQHDERPGAAELCRQDLIDLIASED